MVTMWKNGKLSKSCDALVKLNDVEKVYYDSRLKHVQWLTSVKLNEVGKGYYEARLKHAQWLADQTPQIPKHCFIPIDLKKEHEDELTKPKV